MSVKNDCKGSQYDKADSEIQHTVRWKVTAMEMMTQASDKNH